MLEQMRSSPRVSLLSGTTWSESPRSRTRRLITNVRLLAAENGEARVTANLTSPSGVSSTSKPTSMSGAMCTNWCAAPPVCYFASGVRCLILKLCARTAFDDQTRTRIN